MKSNHDIRNLTVAAVSRTRGAGAAASVAGQAQDEMGQDKNVQKDALFLGVRDWEARGEVTALLRGR